MTLIDPLLQKQQVPPQAIDEPQQLNDSPRPMPRVRTDETIELFGSLAAAGVLGGILCWFLSWGGLLGPALVVGLLFVAIFSIVVRESSGQEAASARIAHVLIVVVSVSAVAPVVAMIGYVVVKGLPALRPGFFVQNMAKVGPLDKGGGAFHSIIGTLEQVGIASVISIPIAVMSAVYLNEMKGRLAVVVRFLVDAMSGVPSIVAGLFIFAFWVIGLHKGPSGFAASLALVVLMLPTVTRTSEEVLRTISDNLREASLALGAPQWRTVVGVVLPTAKSGLLTATLLGIARAIGETAPVVLTALTASGTNKNPFSGRQSSLVTFVFDLLKQPNEVQRQRAATGSLVLLMLVVLLFTIARLAGTTRRK